MHLLDHKHKIMSAESMLNEKRTGACCIELFNQEQNQSVQFQSKYSVHIIWELANFEKAV